MADFLMPEIIRRKREGFELSREEIEFYVRGVCDGSVSEGQIAALCMAVFWRDLSVHERSVLTLAMRDSGVCLRWQGLNGPVLDKHSTGGVGDVVSLILAPMWAACGAYVPMIAGRGLGHTGGTIDKLEAIPNFNPFPKVDSFQRWVREVGCAIIGQTSDLAPADRRIYAVRDVCATVESVALITASILAKKLAEGLDALVMDVKVGSGAFMPSYQDSKILAQSIVDVANASSCPTTALLTDMNQVLASSAGNALEVKEAVRFLRGEGKNDRLREITLTLAAQGLLNAGLARDEEEAQGILDQTIVSGAAAERFAKMVALQGGPSDFIERFEEYLPKASVVKPLIAEEEGIINAMDTRALGVLVIHLGGGRRAPNDVLDYSVGLSDIAPLGTQVKKGDSLVTIHARSEEDWQRAARSYREALSFSDKASVPYPQIYEVIV